MQLVDWLLRVMLSTGPGWVMWLLIALSVVSVAIILERGWFYLTLRDDIGTLARDLQRTLDSGIDAAKKRMSSSPSAEAAVVLAGLESAHRGPKAAEEAMTGAAAIQRIKLEKRLVVLSTLGNNAPFIGLFGTVIGVIVAFDQLEQTQSATNAASQMVSKGVMAAIAEALVATAIGIFVAIPAVAANNAFQRITKGILANTEALSRTLVAHLVTDTGYVLPETNGAASASATTKKGDGERDKPKNAKTSKPAADAEEEA
jgi:biopolymer transport protein ExbB